MRHSFTNELNPVWSRTTGLPQIIDSCAGKIFVSFIESGGKNISTECLFPLYGDFINGSDPAFYRSQFFDSTTWVEGQIDLLEYFFGTSNVWEDGPLVLERQFLLLGLGLTLSSCAVIVICLCVVCLKIHPKEVYD